MRNVAVAPARRGRWERRCAARVCAPCGEQPRERRSALSGGLSRSFAPSAEKEAVRDQGAPFGNAEPSDSPTWNSTPSSLELSYCETLICHFAAWPAT